MKHEFAIPGKKTISPETWMQWDNFALTVTFMTYPEIGDANFKCTI